MGAQLRILRRRIKTVRSMKKITKAMELVATSRLGKAQERVAASRPYAEAITNVLTALASNANLDHPILKSREQVRQAGVLVVSSDRGLCGAYNANAIRTAEELISRLREDGKEPVLYVVGRKALTYYRFRDRPVRQSWTGFSEKPTFSDASGVASDLLGAFERGGGEAGGVDELHIVYTTFRSLITQTPVARLLAPMEVEEAVAAPGLLPA
jgi:F-type H+-transporting ATPase subunit gamma